MGALNFLFVILLGGLGLHFGAFGGGSTPPQQATPAQIEAAKNYRMDLPLEVNCGKDAKGPCMKGQGMLVLEPGEAYEIRGSAPDNAAIVTVEDCTGETIFYNVKKDFAYIYSMAPRMRDQLCYLAITAYAPNYRLSMALMDIRNVKTPMVANVLCSQTEYDRRGVGLCQTKLGKLSILEFKEDVSVHTEAGCEAPVGGPRTFKFSPTRAGKCWHKFLSVAKPEKEFRMTIYSYDEYFMEGR